MPETAMPGSLATCTGGHPEASETYRTPSPGLTPPEWNLPLHDIPGSYGSSLGSGKLCAKGPSLSAFLGLTLPAETSVGREKGGLGGSILYKFHSET